MVVGEWITEPELHAHHRRGWGPRWRHNSVSARFRFSRLGCFAAQIGLLRREVMKALPKILLALTAVAALSVACPAKANLITNPGFETGDLTGWTSSTFLVSGTFNGQAPHSGKFQAVNNFEPASISQSVAT